jgi:lipopolysaccharide/colanic/teichoic acid biosynthesis glycosyltransferase
VKLESTWLRRRESDGRPILRELAMQLERNALMPLIYGDVAAYGDCRPAVASRRPDSRLIPSSYHCRKEKAERILAALLLLPAVPLLLLLMLLVRLTSRGPALFSQVRVGKNGRTFVMHKIRTMRVDAEAASGPVWGLPGDPRATRLGNWLRTLHLDELPQLINVVKGEMSLVGPRPERPEFIPALAAAIPDYLDRITVRPGITGLAQLNLPPDTDLNSVRRKVVLDREYIDRANPWLDFCLLACTTFRIFKVPERRILRSFGLQRDVTLPATRDEVFDDSGSGADYLGISPSAILRQYHASRGDHDGVTLTKSTVKQGTRREAAKRSTTKSPKPR